MALGWLLLWALPVRADTFVVVPPWYQAQDGAALSLHVARVVEAELVKQGHRALPPERAAALVTQERRVACSGGDCAERYRTAAEVNAAVVIRVYRGKPGEGLATSFQLGIQPAVGLEYTVSEVFEGGLHDEAILRALHEALRMYHRGPGPWLQVKGKPEGAAVYVDDRQVGKLPVAVRVALGTHRLRVQAPGFLARSRVVTLAARGGVSEEEMELEEERVGEARVVEASPVTAGSVAVGKAVDLKLRRRERAGVSLIAVGAPLLALGGGWIGMGFRDRNQEGKCLHFDAELSTCGRVRAASDWKTKAITGGAVAATGAAFLLAGILLHVHAPRSLRVAVGVTPGAAMFSVEKDL